MESFYENKYVNVCVMMNVFFELKVNGNRY